MKRLLLAILFSMALVSCVNNASCPKPTWESGKKIYEVQAYSAEEWKDLEVLEEELMPDKRCIAEKKKQLVSKLCRTCEFYCSNGNRISDIGYIRTLELIEACATRDPNT